MFEAPKKYLAVGMCLLVAGGAATLGEMSGNAYRDDVRACVNEGGAGEANRQQCIQEAGDNPRGGYLDIASIALVGGLAAAFFMETEEY